MKYFDTHTHTNIEPLIKQFDNILNEAINQEIGFNIIGVDLDSSTLAVSQASKNKNLYATVGIHPNDIDKYKDANETMNNLEKLYLLNRDKVIAIGECGIDLYYSKDNVENQIY